MKPVSPHHARWFLHINGISPPPTLAHWLVDRTSLTVKLTARSQSFRVQRLRQGRGFCLADERAAIGLMRRQMVQEREVLLRCDGQAMVFAHTVVPLQSTASDWPFFNTLGERSLGTTLFGDPQVQRGQLQFARLQPSHPLFQRARAALPEQNLSTPLLARRCLFRRKNGVLLVTEVFLPTLSSGAHA